MALPLFLWLLPTAAVTAVVVRRFKLPTWLTAEQRAIAEKLVAEAKKQKVDPRVVMAYAEIETNIKNITNGISYGPLQVNAKYYDGPANDLLGPIGIVEGVKKVKTYLRAAGGNPELGRIMYLCGIAGSKDPTKCTEVSKARVREKWRRIAPKWGL